eukprot:6191015-Amphidinium_carterae.1
MLVVSAIIVQNLVGEGSELQGPGTAMAASSASSSALDAVYASGNSKQTGKKRPNDVRETDLQQAVAKA